MNFYEVLSQYESSDTPFAIATIVDASESSPGRTSFKMVVTPDGKVVGSIGGGALEYTARNTAMEMLKSGVRSKLETYKLQDFAKGGIGMACGGNVQVFIETIMPRRQLYIFGGGHIGQALVRYAVDMDFEVTLIDDRPDFAAREMHPSASNLIVCDYSRVDELELCKNAFFVIVTHAHSGDGACLKSLLMRKDLDPAYIGLIGSAKKLARVFRDMIAEGIDREALEFVHAPIGLDTGGQSACEIAIGIAAEISAAKYGHTLLDSMSAKKHPLHIPLCSENPACDGQNGSELESGKKTVSKKEFE